MTILVSAHNPMTGPRHLGHHVSTMKEWPRLQASHECFFVIDDLIATFMYPRDRAEIFDRSIFVAAEFMASGINLKDANIILTSMVPEASELLILLSNYIGSSLCRDLFDRSFLGMISVHDRDELELPLQPSLSEIIYPQLGLPALTLGLKADLFQGGEEISGYVTIMREIVRQFTGAHGEILAAPTWEKPRTPFLPGLDGTHMMSENAIYLSTPTEIKSMSESADYDAGAVRAIYEALRDPEEASELSVSKAADQLQDLIDRECERYRKSEIDSESVLDQLALGAARAKFLLRSTLSEVKQALHIPEVLEY